jgi:hypothetical protein
MTVFPRTRCELSRIFNQVLLEIYRNHAHKLKTINRPWITRHVLEDFRAALIRNGSPYKECFGFLDGTVRPICRPNKNQKQVNKNT